MPSGPAEQPLTFSAGTDLVLSMITLPRCCIIKRLRFKVSCFDRHSTATCPTSTLLPAPSSLPLAPSYTISCLSGSDFLPLPRRTISRLLPTPPSSNPDSLFPKVFSARPGTALRFVLPTDNLPWSGWAPSSSYPFACPVTRPGQRRTRLGSPTSPTFPCLSLTLPLSHMRIRSVVARAPPLECRIHSSEETVYPSVLVLRAVAGCVEALGPASLGEGEHDSVGAADEKKAVLMSALA